MIAEIPEDIPHELVRPRQTPSIFGEVNHDLCLVFALWTDRSVVAGYSDVGWPDGWQPHAWYSPAFHSWGEVRAWVQGTAKGVVFCMGVAHPETK